MEGDERPVAYFDCQPVDSGEDDTIFIERVLAVIDVTIERELWIEIDYPPIIFAK